MLRFLISYILKLYVPLLHNVYNCYGFADGYCGLVNFCEGYDLHVQMMLMVLSCCIMTVGSFPIFVFLSGDAIDTITAISMFCRLGLVTFLDRFGILLSGFHGSSCFRCSTSWEVVLW